MNQYLLFAIPIFSIAGMYYLNKKYTAEEIILLGLNKFSICQMAYLNNVYKPLIHNVIEPLQKLKWNYLNNNIHFIKDNDVKYTFDSLEHMDSCDVTDDDHDFILHYTNHKMDKVNIYEKIGEINFNDENPKTKIKYIMGELRHFKEEYTKLKDNSEMSSDDDSTPHVITLNMMELEKYLQIGNKLFKKEFVKWYCNKYHKYDIMTDNYEIHLVDVNFNKTKLSNKHHLIINEDNHELINDVPKTDEPTLVNENRLWFWQNKN